VTRHSAPFTPRVSGIRSVRGAFDDLSALQRRVVAFDELIGLATDATKTGQTQRVNGWP
jgi:hypothetical protein